MRRMGIAAIVVLVLAASVLVASRVHIVEQWALYTSSGPNQPLRLFLDPFPAKRYCQYDADAVVHSGGRAQCRKRIRLALDRRASDQLLWTFITEWDALCGDATS